MILTVVRNIEGNIMIAGALDVGERLAEQELQKEEDGMDN
jgi:hypothetical protein